MAYRRANHLSSKPLPRDPMLRTVCQTCESSRATCGVRWESAWRTHRSANPGQPKVTHYCVCKHFEINVPKVLCYVFQISICSFWGGGTISTSGGLVDGSIFKIFPWECWKWTLFKSKLKLKLFSLLFVHLVGFFLVGWWFELCSLIVLLLSSPSEG